MMVLLASLCWPILRSMRRAAVPCVVGFALLLSASTWAINPAAKAKSSFLDFKQEAAESAAAGRILMVMFEQEHCSYCEEMRRINLTDPEAITLIDKHFDLLSLDILGDREMTTIAGKTMSEKEYAGTLKVQLTPMTVFFAPGGQELFRMAGYYKPPMFKAALRFVAERHYQEEPFREYVRRTAADSPAAKLKDEPFFTATIDLAASLASAAKRGKGLAMVFERPGCPACQELHTQSFADQQLVAALTGAFDVVRLDTQGTRKLRHLDGAISRESRIAEIMDIGYTPTVIFLDPQGHETFRLDSFRRPAHVARVIQYLATGAYRSHTTFQEWLRAQRPLAGTETSGAETAQVLR
jgi:thioredoxin-related protein